MFMSVIAATNIACQSPALSMSHGTSQWLLIVTIATGQCCPCMIFCHIAMPMSMHHLHVSNHALLLHVAAWWLTGLEFRHT